MICHSHIIICMCMHTHVHVGVYILVIHSLQTVSEQTFEIRAVADGIPELFESFIVSLVSTEGGGRIVDPSEARIAIQASDDPN